VGPGFVLHDDEVSLVERMNAHRTGAPVVGGDITTFLSLNAPSAYEGGEIDFPLHGITMKSPIGSLIIFPATRAYPHQVKPITAGELYALVMRPVIERAINPFTSKGSE
jgi:predicted 2-oxoglutarate/Fe(II)-dependent dioxygenase YbiX